MTAYNIVRMRVRAGQQRSFETMNAVERTSVPKGARRADLVKTGDTSYCFIGEWSSYMDIVAARAEMIADLGRFRDILVDLGGGLGVTFPVSGEAVVEFEGGAGQSTPGSTRPAFSIARYRARPGREQDFVVAVKQAVSNPDVGKAGFRRAALVDVGTRAFILLGEWDSLLLLNKANPQMIGTIDSHRELLEDMSSVGSAHVASGEVVVAYRVT
jgi:hypothetical protein